MTDYINEYDRYLPDTDVASILMLELKTRREERMIKRSIEEVDRAFERYKKTVKDNQKETQR